MSAIVKLKFTKPSATDKWFFENYWPLPVENHQIFPDNLIGMLNINDIIVEEITESIWDDVYANFDNLNEDYKESILGFFSDSDSIAVINYLLGIELVTLEQITELEKWSTRQPYNSDILKTINLQVLSISFFFWKNGGTWHINPLTTTWTGVWEFDTWENLVNAYNNKILDPEANTADYTIDKIKEWLELSNQTVEEIFILDGVVVTENVPKKF